MEVTHLRKSIKRLNHFLVAGTKLDACGYLWIPNICRFKSACFSWGIQPPYFPLTLSMWEEKSKKDLSQAGDVIGSVGKCMSMRPLQCMRSGFISRYLLSIRTWDRCRYRYWDRVIDIFHVLGHDWSPSSWPQTWARFLHSSWAGPVHLTEESLHTALWNSP